MVDIEPLRQDGFFYVNLEKGDLYDQTAARHLDLTDKCGPLNIFSKDVASGIASRINHLATQLRITNAQIDTQGRITNAASNCVLLAILVSPNWRPGRVYPVKMLRAFESIGSMSSDELAKFGATISLPHQNNLKEEPNG